MTLDENTLLEIEDCINALDETVGLNTDTLLDIDKAIRKQRKVNALKTSSESAKVCKHENITSSDGCDECLDCGVRNY